MNPIAVLALVATIAVPSSPSSPSSPASPTVLTSPTVALDLDELIARATDSAPALAEARARLAVAEAAVVGARLSMPEDPTLELGAGGRVGGGQDGADLGVSVRQAFEVSGAAGLRQQAAAHEVRASELDIDRVRAAVRGAVTHAFFEALVTDAEVEVAEASLADALRLVEIANTRVAAGDAAPLQARFAGIALGRARDDAIAAREARSAAQLALGREAGFDDAIAVSPTGSLLRPEALPSLATLRDAAAGQPTLLALGATLAGENATSAAVERDAVPRPTFGVDYAVEGARPSSPGGASQTQHIVMATVSVPVPLFRGSEAEQAASHARRLVIESALLATRQQIAGRVAEAWVRADSARARVLLAIDDMLPALTETQRLLDEGLASGVLDIDEVMVGRARVLSARRDALHAWRRWFTARADLEGATGTPLP